MRKMKEITERTVDTVKNFTKAPIDNLGFLVPVIMAIVSVVAALIGYILYIIHGGYSDQVSLIKEFGTDGISQGFTSGSVGLLTGGTIPKVIWILFLVQMIIMLVSYFKTVGKAKRIIMIIDLILLTIVIALFTVVVMISEGPLVFSEEQMMSALSFFERVTVNLKAILITYAVFAVVSVVTFIVLILISECRWMLGYGMLSLGVNYIAAPLVVLLLENIIPLVSGIVVLAIIGLVIFLVFKIFLGGGDGESTSSSGSYSSGSSPSYSRNEIKETKPVEKQPYQEVKKYDLNTIFWRDKGGCGIMVPQADCIYFKNAWGEKTYSCTVHDFEKGKVAIMNKNKRVMSIVGCKTPER